MLDFVRTRLRGTSERITLYEIQRLKPEVEATLNARVLHETERYAGREWLRAFAEDELAVGERRILELDKCDVVVHRGPNGYLAFNNACPHVRLPFYDRRPLSEEHVAKLPPRQSVVTDDLGIVCRWHGKPVLEMLEREALGGNSRQAGSCVWHAVGLQRSVREWAIRQGWGGRPVRQEQAQGILIAALGVLASHLGYRAAA
jgi:nitrite reductase/ring-hydroxylating ferredoxin subunit